MTKRKCWAEHYSRCSDDISGEHIVSKCLFSNYVTVIGFNWCKDQEKQIGINSMVANCLCSKHNSELSELDIAAFDVWNVLREFCRLNNVREPRKKKRWNKAVIKSDATKFERWCFKTAVNILSSGSYMTVSDWNPPEHLVRFIFGKEKLPQGCGIGSYAAAGDEIKSADTFAFSALSANDGRVIFGGLIEFRGLKIVLSWNTPVNDLTIPLRFIMSDMRKAVRYPFFERIDHKGTNVTIVLDWSGKYDNEKSRFIKSLRKRYKPGCP